MRALIEFEDMHFIN